MVSSVVYYVTLSAILSANLLSCSSKPYRVLQSEGDLHVFRVKSRYASVQCEILENEKSGLMIHVVDETDTYFTLLGYQYPRRKCADAQEVIDKILANRAEVLIAGVGSLNQPRVIQRDTWRFGDLGSFPGNSRVFSLWGIRNEAGQCFGTLPGKIDCPN